MTGTDRLFVAAVVALAAALRLLALGAAPLDAEEAAHAWRALRLATAGDAEVAGLTSPFTAAAQALVFAFVGAGDALARVPAAACGLALVGAPVLAWRWLGRGRTLCLCALFAVEPVAVDWSRRAAGESAAALGAVLVALTLLGWQAAARRRADEGRSWALATAAACGFLVTTGPAAWTLLPPLALAAWRLRPWAAAAVQPGRLLGAAGVAAIVCSTAGLLAIPWASAVAASLTSALARGPAAPPAAVFVAAAALAALAIGAVGLAGVPRGRSLVHAAAIGWGVLVVVAAPRPSCAALALACTACAADGLAASSGRSRGRRMLAAIALLGLAALPRLVRGPAAPREDRMLAALAADVRETAVDRGHAANEMPVVIVTEPPDAEIAWALRDVRSLAWSAARPAVGGVAPLLVAPAAAAGTVPGYARRPYGAGPRAVVLWVPDAR